MSIDTPLGRCYFNTRHQGGGYWRLSNGPFKRKYLHRAAFEAIAGRPVRDGFVIHHMKGRDHFCGESLVEIQACLHIKSEQLRDPYTGEWITPEQYNRRYNGAV